MILYISLRAALIYGIRTSKWEFTKRKHLAYMLLHLKLLYYS